MFLIKKIKLTLLFTLALMSGLVSYGQIEFGNGYAMGDFVNIAISGERGREGTDVVGAGFHNRAPGTRCGFVADPFATGWDPTGFNGDFFMPGTPENGWGFQMDGVNYSNNWNVYEILQNPDNVISHSTEGDCITVEWEGVVAGITVNVKYHLIVGDLFYTTEITMINNSGVDKTDIYYYRNVDPDNNQPISFDYSTTNTIVSQPGADCQKSLVSAEHTLPHDSYVGFGALGDKFRVSHGGFGNRDGSDIWNGTGGLTGVVGSSVYADAAISLAYKTDIANTDTVNFTYAVVLSEDAVESAFSSLYYIDFESAGGIGGGLISQCSPVVDSATSCQGAPVTLTVDGPNAGDYTWVWTSDPLDPDAPTEGPIIVVSPTETTSYTVVGTPISDCLTSTITKTIVVVFTEGPEISITDPGPYCEDFNLDDLVFEDLNGTTDPNIIFLSEHPDSASQVEPEYVGPMMGPDDEVWLLIGDPEGGCYDAVLIEIDFGGLGAAGVDSSIALCGIEGTIIDLHDLIEVGANTLGSFDEVTFSGQFTEATGEFDVSGLSGTYEFTYTVAGIAPCPDDEATFIVEVYGQPTANFEYSVDGVSSADGLGSTCITNTVNFEDFSTIPAPSTITSWDWDFGGDGTSTLEDPSHLFTTTGTFIITLTVTTDNGCTSTFTKEIIIYSEPILDVIFNSPSCFGFNDGSITAFVAGGAGTFDIEITNADGDVLNAEGSNTANSLTSGVYYINVVDASGCSATATIIITDPIQLVAHYRVVPPACYGDSGYIVIDSVDGEAINNVMAYFWAPVTDVDNGFEADSVNVVAGEYILQINDQRGCSETVTITMTQPDEIVFTSDLGYDPAYCRLFGYQKGNGVVYGSAIGGTGSLDYTWTDLSGEFGPWDNTTVGGLNPGNYKLTVTDANGCIRDTIIMVDSLNPIAKFTVDSEQLNADCKGTADVQVEFTNTSENFSNPNNPLASPIFRWNLDTPDDEWVVTEDFYFKPDSLYEARGVSYDIEVCLITYNSNGCSDEYCKILTIFEPIKFDGVNIFSPNNDGTNDVFTFEFKSASIAELECVIVNRWGVKVGEINTPNGTWDGTDLNGDACNDGVYFYTYTAKADNGEAIEGQGTLQIIGTK